MRYDNWFDFQRDITYLIPVSDKFDNQVEIRETFSTMIDLCKGLYSDIGYSDMLLQFDNEPDLTHATLILTEAKINFKTREK